MNLHPLEKSILDTWPPEHWKDRRLLVAVSGGPDSVACLRSLLRLSSAERIVAAHYNHRWRGAASDGDATFVRELCEQLQVKLVEGCASPSSQARSEEHARADRYVFLAGAAFDDGSRYVVTGHTADDRVETALHNLLRGSGLRGIVGPKRFRPLQDDLVLVRPLLGVFREQVIDFLSSIGQSYRIDDSNTNEAYTRNFIRHRLLPLARQHYPSGVDRQILSFAEIADETLQALDELAQRWLEGVDRVGRDFPEELRVRLKLVQPWVVPNSKIADYPWPIIREALTRVWTDRQWPLQAMTRGHWSNLRQALLTNTQPSVKCKCLLNLPGALRVVSVGDWRAVGQSSQSKAR